MVQASKIHIVAGSSHPDFANRICNRLNIDVIVARVQQFSNGETLVEIGHDIKGAKVYVVQSPNPGDSLDRHLMELLLLLGACKAAAASTIITVVPCLPYARQDKPESFDGSKDANVPISAKIVAKMLESAGANQVICLDLHSPQITGFFDIPVQNLQAQSEFASWIRTNVADWKSKIVLVAPDAGGVERVIGLANDLEVDFVIINKQRQKANEVASMTLAGNVEGRSALIVDDIADTCGTLSLAAEKLMDAGATEVLALIVHGLFSGKALQKLNESKITKIVVTNSLPQGENLKGWSQLEVLDVSTVFANVIKVCDN